MRHLARFFLLLVGTVIYHQYGQEEHQQEQLRAACAAKGGKLALSNLCINMKPILDELTGAIVLPRRRHCNFGQQSQLLDPHQHSSLEVCCSPFGSVNTT